MTSNPESDVGAFSVPIFLRPYVGNYENNFSDGSLLFVSKSEQNTMVAGQQYTGFDLPTLNMLLQAKDKTSMLVQNSVVKAQIEKLLRPFDSLIMDIASDLPKQLNYVGPMANTVRDPKRRALQKKLAFDASGTSFVRNIFSSTATVGDYLYLVCSQRPVTTGGLVDPTGNVIAAYAPNQVTHASLQVYGVASKDPVLYQSSVYNGSTPEYERTVTKKRKIRTYEIVDGQFQSTAPESEGTAQFPSQEPAWIKRIGRVIEMPQGCCTSKQISEALRNQLKLATLPLLHVEL